MSLRIKTPKLSGNPVNVALLAAYYAGRDRFFYGWTSMFKDDMRKPCWVTDALSGFGCVLSYFTDACAFRDMLP